MSGQVKKEILSIAKKDIICNDDGYYIFWPSPGSGYLESYQLRIIADHLDAINKEWDNTVNRYFEDMDAPR